MSNITISINLLNPLPNVIIEWESFLEEVFTILLFVTGASTNYSIPIPCQTNYEQLKTTLQRVKKSHCPGSGYGVPRWKCPSAPEWSVKIWLICIFHFVYIRWYCRCRYGLNPGSSRCSHGVTRPYTVSLLSVKDVPRGRPVLVPVHVPVLPGMTTVLPGDGVATVLLGLLGLHSVLFMFPIKAV